MTGSTQIDFAGTVKEAREFAAQHRDKFPRTFNVFLGKLRSPNGDALLFAAWRNESERNQVRDVLEQLGWGNGSIGEVEYKTNRAESRAHLKGKG